MTYATESVTELTTGLAKAVARRMPAEAVYNGLTFTLWYNMAIPVITVIHPEDGVVFEDMASDKPELMREFLASFL